MAQDNRLHPAIIADLLPAGLEIETILKANDGGGSNYSGPYKWAGELTFPRVAEARDDRFIAAVDVRGRKRFTLGYIVRAVTPGSYVMPGTVIEDMYKPGIIGRTSVGRIEITGGD